MSRRPLEPGIKEVAWQRTSLSYRLALLGRFRARLVERRRELLAALSEVRPGSSLAELKASELVPLLDACRFLEREAPRALEPKRLGLKGQPAWLWGVQTVVYREPLGRILIIGPGNYPLFLPLVQALSAWAAGNVVWLQSAPGTLPLHRFLQELFCSIGGEPELFRLLGEEHEATTEALQAGVQKAVLIGSAQTGESLLPQISRHLVPSIAELSGWDAVFAHPETDADLLARAVAFGLSLNGGQTCVAPRRIFFQGPLSGLERALSEALASRPLTELTPDEFKLVHAEVKTGARAITAGGAEQGPVVLCGVRADSPLLREPVFGSLAAVRAVESDEQALEEANLCSFALGASIFGPIEWAEAMALRVPAQMVSVNDLVVATADPRLAFGGSRRSGYGRMRGLEGLLEMTQTRSVSVRRGGSVDHLSPPTPLDDKILDSFLVMSHGASLGNRFKALLEMIFAIGRERVRRRFHRTVPSPGSRL